MMKIKLARKLIKTSWSWKEKEKENERKRKLV